MRVSDPTGTLLRQRLRPKGPDPLGEGSAVSGMDGVHGPLVAGLLRRV